MSRPDKLNGREWWAINNRRNTIIGGHDDFLGEIKNRVKELRKTKTQDEVIAIIEEEYAILFGTRNELEEFVSNNW